MQIADVYARLLLDDKGVDKSLTQELPRKAEEGGKRAGSGFGRTFGTVAKAAIGGILGGVGGSIFGTALSGGVQLNQTVAEFRAQTGATAEETESAQKKISELFRTNLQGYETIGETLAKARTDLGLTQDEAEKATEAFLRFATATGQDASEAVSSFDDILDAWGLEASDATKIMDVLVASHQRYGGSVEDAETALAELAPSLRAANMSWEDGVTWLNLFASKGMDAKTATTALSQALNRVESPKELKKLVDDISKTKDPFERARKASELFGTRAGPDLANALEKVDWDEYRVSVEDAAGATERAAKAIESSATNQAQLFVKNIVGALNERAAEFEPLLVAFASLATIAGPIMTVVGSTLGAILAAAIPIGMAALPFILVGAILGAIVVLANNPELAGQAMAIGGQIVGAIGDALAGILPVVGQALGKTVVVVASWVGTIVSKIGDIPGLIGSLVPGVVDVFSRVGGAVLGVVGDLVRRVVGAILGIPGKAGEIVGKFGDLGRRAVEAFIGFVAGLPGRVAGIVGDVGKNIGGFIGGLIPKFAEGTERVPRTGLAVVHAGEMIVPAHIAEDVRSGSAVLGAKGGGSMISVVVNNPVPEPASTSVQRELRKLAYLGVIS